MPSLISWIAQSTAVTTFSTIAAFFVYTKHVKVADFDPNLDPLFLSKWHRLYNPEHNIPLADEAVRKIPLWMVKKELVEDAEKGGSKLVEAFTGGIWGGFGYAFQRKYLERKYRNNTTTAHQIWDKKALLTNTYEPGTEITDHFNVVSKTANAIVLRCGDSPMNSPNGPRDADGLMEVTAKADFEKGFAEFRFRFLFYQGVGKATAKPLSEMGGVLDWLHKQYAALLVESGLKNVRT